MMKKHDVVGSDVTYASAFQYIKCMCNSAYHVYHNYGRQISTFENVVGLQISTSEIEYLE